MFSLASLRSDWWTTCPELVDDFVGIRTGAESLRHPVENWVARVARQRGVWPSQRAAISALVLHGASPREARSAAKAAFRA